MVIQFPSEKSNLVTNAVTNIKKELLTVIVSRHSSKAKQPNRQLKNAV